VVARAHFDIRKCRMQFPVCGTVSCVLSQKCRKKQRKTSYSAWAKNPHKTYWAIF